MKRITANISIINPELFEKAYSAYMQTYGYAPGTAYLNKDTLNSLNSNSDNAISITYEIDPQMGYGEVAFG